jgi:hypothetical protein
VLGIECDGAAYHSSRSARDRDRLRQAVLEYHGWTIHRIWSTDWFQRPQEQLRRTVATIEAAKAELEARGAGRAEGKNRAVQSERKLKRHCDEHDESRANRHAGDQRRPSRVRREFLFEKLPEPWKLVGRFYYGLCDRFHRHRPRMITTADSLIRNSSGSGLSTSTRTGYREARWTQLRVRCTSGRPLWKVPITSAFGVTPN